MTFDTAIIGAASGIVSAGFAIAGFWMMLGGRIQKAESTGESALQTGAEACEDVKRIAAQIATLEREQTDDMDRLRREFGQTVEAIRTKVHEFETWARDEFMRKQSFEQALTRVEKAADERDRKIDERFNRMEGKLDEVVKALLQVARGAAKSAT